MQYGMLKEIWNNHQWEKCWYDSFIKNLRKWHPFHKAILKQSHWWVRYNQWKFDKFIEEYKEIYWEPKVSKWTLRARINILYMDIQEAFTKPSMRVNSGYNK